MDMEVDTNPYRNLESDITPTQFEIFCLETVKAYAEREELKDFKINHNQKIETYDSTYQIDVFAEYTALGCNHKVIIECKHHAGNIKRTLVTDLYTKMQSIGAQKGILISTSGFQSDTVKFAQVHGIALWQVFDNCIKHISNSASRAVLSEMTWNMAVERYLPKYFVMEWDCEEDYPYDQIYPTPQMYQNARVKASEDLKTRGSYHV